MFSRAPSRAQAWSRTIGEYSSKGQWKEVLSHFLRLKSAQEATPPDPSVFPLAVKACTKLRAYANGVVLHADVIKIGLLSYPSISNSIMDFYIKCESLESALDVFYGAARRDSVSWNVVLCGLLDQGEYAEGMSLLMRAKLDGFRPNVATLVFALQACWNLGTADEGLSLHGSIIRIGFLSDISVVNSLLNMYVKMGNMDSGRRLFDEMLERDVISWSAMMSGYSQCGEPERALSLFKEMCADGVVAVDGVCMVAVLQACSRPGDVYNGRSVHGQVVRRGFSFDSFVGNSLVYMYSKCLDVESSCDVFSEMHNKTTVTWNSVLSGLVYNEKHVEAMELFRSMKEAGVEADAITLVNLLQLCRSYKEANWCQSIHSYVIRKGLEANELVLNTLLDSYSKCEMVELALQLFKMLERKCLVVWSTMIGALARCGMPDEAMSLFHEMKQAQERPNWVTMLTLIESCTVSADFERSRWAHSMVLKTGMAGNVAVGTALLEMYAKCGEIIVSRKVFDEMSDRNLFTWSTMIAGYGMNGAAHEAVALFHEMESHGIKPNEVTFLSILSACSHDGLVKEGRSIFEHMIRDHGINPSSEHFSCMVDILGRAGELETAIDLIEKMPHDVDPGASVWGALLNACTNSGGHSELGRRVLQHVLELEPSSSNTYQLAANMYAKGGQWSELARVRRLVREKGLKVVAGYSLVHVGHRACKFVAGDRYNPQAEEIYAVVKDLHICMRRMGEMVDQCV